MNVEKKSSTVTYAIRLTVILIFCAMLIFPLALMALDGPDRTEMESEAATKLKPLRADTYLDGSFQSSFEAWFSAHYPLRSNLVKSYRQLQFDIENSKPAIGVMKLLRGKLWEKPKDPTPPDDPSKPSDPSNPSDPSKPSDPTNPTDPSKPTDPTKPTDPMTIYTDPNNIYARINLRQMMQQIVEPSGFKGSNRVYIGKSGYLFEKAYMDEYFGYSKPYTDVTDEGMWENIEKLEYIQKELEKRGITMLYVISSSKASQYSEYIPDWYRETQTAKAGYVRPIDRYRKMLAASSINYLDSSEYYKEIGLLVTFPKTGIHWNALAAFESTAQLLRMYETASGRNCRLLDTKGVLTSSTPFNQGNPEQDVYNILYGTLDVKGILDDEYYAPDIVLSNTDQPKLNAFLQGGSFTHSIRYYLNNCNIANVDSIYYNGLNGGSTWGDKSPWTQGAEVWSYWLKDKDVVIFEATEQQIRGGHYTGGDWTKAAKDSNIGHNVVYDSLYEYLKAHEGEY